MAEKLYISAEGYRRLADELHTLMTVERPKVVNTVAAAAAEGDRSENAEYIYGKKRLRQIDRRVEFLTRHLDRLEVAAPPTATDRVRFLSYVEIENQDGEEKCYRIVGADETDAKAGWISWKSPVGSALLGKRLDDEVRVRTPGGFVELTIVGIHARRP
ncbi:MAG: transcription elongation factor GreB [Myxococcales bacterium]|nr:transcription elongation factor GreB [Myxococcales bacterium]